MVFSNKRGFTLIEMIVVISILAILSTVSFLSLSSYTAKSRDAKRMSDIDNLESSIELSLINSSSYPTPDNAVEVTYSGTVVWIQGTVGESVIQQLREFSSVPLDPLYENEYSYSILKGSDEFQVGSILEGDLFSSNTNELVNRTNAAKKSYYAYIRGNYNGITVMVKVGTTHYFFAVPSIIATDLSDSDLDTIIESKALVYNGFKNIPESYKGNDITMDGNFDFGGTGFDILVSTGNLNSISSDGDLLNDFGIKLKDIYDGTALEADLKYSEIINMESQDEIFNIVGNILNDNLGGLVDLSNTCTFEPNYKHAIFTIGEPLFNNTPWQLDDPTAPCYYTCQPGYTGVECNELAFTCASEPTYSNANFVIGVPLLDNTTWQKDSGSSPCYYYCDAGYEGVDCNTTPAGSCEEEPDYEHADFTYGNPVISDTVWQQTNVNDPCYYECEDGHSGFTCDDEDDDESCASQPEHQYAIFVEGNPTEKHESWQNTDSNNACYYYCIDGHEGYNCTVDEDDEESDHDHNSDGFDDHDDDDGHDSDGDGYDEDDDD